MTNLGGANNLGVIFKYWYCNPVTFSQTISICAGQSVTVGTNTYTANGVYTSIFHLPQATAPLVSIQ